MPGGEKNMELHRVVEDDIAVIAVSGRLDTATAPDFEKQSLSRVEEGDKKILLDFSGLEYISSAGLRAILALAKRAKASGGSVAVCAMTGMVEEVFSISGFDAFIPVASTKEKGLEALR